MNTGMKLLLTAALAVSLLVPVAALAQGKQPPAKEARGQAKAAKVMKVDTKKPKPVRIKAPPKPGVKTVVAPGTWRVHRHRGNSPLFEPGREKEWVEHPGPGKRPVIKRQGPPGKGMAKGHR